jgi:hypothetical protein
MLARAAQRPIYKSRRTSMLRTSAIGLACAVALSLCTAAPAAAAMHGGGGGGGGGISHGGGGIGGGGPGGGISHGGPGPGSMISHGGGPGVGTGFSSGTRSNVATLHDRDFGRRFDRDHDFDRGRDRDRDRFRRFFPGFGFDTYSDIDVYPYEDCYVLHRVWTRFGLRLRRIWVCG